MDHHFVWKRLYSIINLKRDVPPLNIVLIDWKFLKMLLLIKMICILLSKKELVRKNKMFGKPMIIHD